jgi:hypothetical protein
MTHGDVSCDDPVFVLCMARSGSTLLRFLLDAHPELACPPETNLPALSAQLAGVWSMLDGTPLAGEPAADAAAIPGAAIGGVRRMLDDMTGEYLRRRGKRRFCDKSLGAAPQVPMLVQMFPGARFICLYRHPMDMIASGIEACPWGLNGFGFDPYAAASPGNSVHALAHFWADNATSILAAEEQFPDHCHRVRYEDLVADPEAVAAGVFAFLGVAPAPGISLACFGRDRELIGPADFKIWHTSEIKADSVGRGWAIPAQSIRPSTRGAVNELAAKLGYLPVDDSWGVAPSAPDPRLHQMRLGSGDGAPTARRNALLLPAGQRALGAQLQAGLAGPAADAFTRRWGQFASEAFHVTCAPPGGMPVRWRVDLAARTARIAPALPGVGAASVQWEILGAPDAWEKLLRGELNLSVAIRRRDMRYYEASEGVPGGARMRLGLLAEILGSTVWDHAGPVSNQTESAAVTARA